MYIEDVAYLSWEVSRLCRGKAAIVNLAFRAALKGLITQLCGSAGRRVVVISVFAARALSLQTLERLRRGNHKN
jgi:hypothetical protein